jgi:hypothetical protein
MAGDCALTCPNHPIPVPSRERLSIAAHDMRNYGPPPRMRLLLRRAVKEHREADFRDMAAIDRTAKRSNRPMSNLVEDARRAAGLFSLHRHKVDLVELLTTCQWYCRWIPVRPCVEAPTRTLLPFPGSERISGARQRYR